MRKRMLAVDMHWLVTADCYEKHETKARVANDTCMCEFGYVHHDGKRYLNVRLLILGGG
jgi:hypothetical protein